MSGLIPREFINEVLARTDIVAIIDSRIPLKKAGQNHQACCPFHSEKSPSFTVSHTKQFYYCFGCGASGNAIGFLMAYDRLSFVDAVEVLAKALGMAIPATGISKNIEKSKEIYEVLAEAKQFYQQQLKQSTEAIAYLKSRGLSGEIAKRYAIGFAPNEWEGLLRHVRHQTGFVQSGLFIEKDNKSQYYDRFRHRIMFPIHDRRGRVIGFGGRVLDDSQPKYLNSPETPVFHKSNVLYGLYEARQANKTLDRLIVVEGYMDVVALAQAGIDYAVATLGTATTTQHVSQLFQQTNHIVFCFDGDRAGLQAASRALEAALSELQEQTHVQFLFLAQGEDPDTTVRKIGKDAFLQSIDHAESLADFLFRTVKGNINIGTVEGRAEFAKRMLPYLEKIPAPILKEMLLDRLSEIVRVDKTRLKQFIQEAEVNETQEIVGKIARTPMRLAIALLLQNPSLAKAPSEVINTLSMPGSDILQAMFQLLIDHPELNTAALLEYWREQKSFALLNRLAFWDHGVPEKGLVAEWQGILKNLMRQQRQYDIDLLVRKANQEALTHEEKQNLQMLLAIKE